MIRFRMGTGVVGRPIGGRRFFGDFSAADRGKIA